jgi:hypothetical protein
MKAILFILANFLITCVSAQKIKEYQCFWNGKNADVFQANNKDFKYSEKGMFYYYLSNDQDNIYINLKIFDNNVKQMILRSGITVWINTDGKKNKTMGVKFPVGPQRMRNDISSNPSEKPLPQTNHAGMGNQKTPPGLNGGSDIDTKSLLLIGFNKSDPVLISNFENGNFRGSINIQKEYMYYQLILPISKLPVIKKNPNKKKEYFVMGLSHESAQSMSMRNGMNGRSGGNGMPGGRMSGGGGGRMSGGRGGRMSGGGGRMAGGEGTHAYNPDSESTSIVWFNNITLATE